MLLGQVVGTQPNYYLNALERSYRSGKAYPLIVMIHPIVSQPSWMLQFPPSKIATLSSGEFVGMVSDNPDEKIELKIFHSEIINDHEAIATEEENYREIPVIKKVEILTIQNTYSQIKMDIKMLVETVSERLKANEGISSCSVEELKVSQTEDNGTRIGLSR